MMDIHRLDRNFSSSLGLSEDHRPRLFNVQEDPSERCEVSDQEERVRGWAVLTGER